MINGLPLDYLSAFSQLEIAGLSPADCERGADMLSSIMPSRATIDNPDPAQLLVQDFLTLYGAHQETAWDYLEKLAKKGYA